MANNLTTWDPFQEFVSLREAMDRLFEESFVRPRRLVAGDGEARLPVDMYETTNEIVVKARVPGVNPDDLQITATEDAITIKGRFTSEAESEEAKKWNWLYHELWHGTFSRVLPLHTKVQIDKVEANFKNGLLTLTIPKAEEVKPKTITVKVSK